MAMSMEKYGRAGMKKTYCVAKNRYLSNGLMSLLCVEAEPSHRILWIPHDEAWSKLTLEDGCPGSVLSLPFFFMCDHCELVFWFMLVRYRSLSYFTH